MISSVTVSTWWIPWVALGVATTCAGYVVRRVIKAIKAWVVGFFEDIVHRLEPNGGNTNNIGDVGKRVEDKIDALAGEFTAHAINDAKVQETLVKGHAHLQGLIDAFLVGVQTAAKDKSG